VVSEKAGKVTVGAGRDAGSEMGPVVTAEAKERIEGLIGAGQRQGARLAVDGRGLVVPGYEQGFFVGPTVLDAVTPEMDVYRRRSSARCSRCCGPTRWTRRSRWSTPTRTATAPRCSPLRRGGAAVRARRQGRMVGVNVPIPVPMAYYSFGGWKDSLFGDKHVHGPEGVSFYTRAKVVTSRWPHVEHASGRQLPLPDGSIASDAPTIRRTDMSRNTRLRWAALVAGVALVLAGCSSTGGKQAEESANNAVGAGKADTPRSRSRW
jgi:malonate-semialdehyde dehydrogenase (acetylating)/methylmalonate-semialdehyde dehydrogenase